MSKQIKTLIILTFIFPILVLSGCKPVISLTATPLLGKAPLEVVFDASGTTDKDCSELTYKWDFGDGSDVQSGVSLTNSTHTYNQSGTYTVTLKVTDCKTISSSATETITITVGEPDYPVVIKLTADKVSGIMPLMVNFDASGTSQSGTTDLTYEWDFDGDGTIDASGTNLTVVSHTYEDAKTYIAKLTVTGKDDIKASETVSIEVNEPGPINIILSATPLSGESPLNVQFDATGTTQEGSSELVYEWDFNDDGTVDATGTNLTKVSHTYGNAGTYTARLEVKNTNFFSSSSEASASITVTKASNSIVGEYANLIPEDSEAAYDPKRFAVITGEVKDIKGNPLNGVIITVHKLNELEGYYGKTETKLHGKFSFPVNGGGNLTIQYERPGYLTVHRQVDISWNDVISIEPVVMINRDDEYTIVDFDNNPNTVITHQSSESLDSSGTRSCTMIFTGDNKAYNVDENGQRGTEITTPLKIRATEYTEGTNGLLAMPAALPSDIAYTYCVELSADNIDRIEFNKPVIIYLNNFLKFPVGTTVPSFSYNRDKGIWIPEKTGVVVQLLHINDGKTPANVVNAIDADGDTQPDDIDGSGSYWDDALGLNDPDKYHPDELYWRSEVSHFSPWDLNFPFCFPDGAIEPNAIKGISVDSQKVDNLDCDTNTHSYANDRSRIIHEDVKIPGTDLSLHYASNQVAGYKYRIIIPVSGPTIPTDLQSMTVEIRIAGTYFCTEMLPEASKTYVYNWDGRDFRGTVVTGTALATINVGFKYKNCVYCQGRSSYPMTERSILTREYGIMYKTTKLQIPVKRPDSSMIAKGWTLSNHHYLDKYNPTLLYKGNGILVKEGKYKIERFAGVGPYAGDDRDGIPAKSAQVKPAHLAHDPQGNLYIADIESNKIRKVDSSGLITTVAGGGTITPEYADGIKATDAELFQPYGVFVDSSGNVYIADTGHNLIRKVDRNGIITTVAGLVNNPHDHIAFSYFNSFHFNGDSIPATSATLCNPTSVVVDNAGNIYIADTINARIRKVDTKGIISTLDFIIDLEGSYTGTPRDIKIDKQGNIYYCTSQLRKMDLSGKITNLDHGKVCWVDWDGSFIWGIGLDDSGTIYLADQVTGTAVIKRMDREGNMQTFAGNDCIGSGLSYIDPPLSLDDQFYSYTFGLDFDPVGNLYMADSGNNCIWKITMPSNSSAVASDMAEGDMAFVEEGFVYIFDGSGRHKKTIDLDTNTTLIEFAYNDEGLISAITDRFNQVITIDRKPTGEVTGIVSPDGIRTTIEVGTSGTLDRIILPDNSSYSFTYSNDDLMTFKNDPKGYTIQHVFDQITGRLNDSYDFRNGSIYGWWHFENPVTSTSVIISTVTSGEGNTTSYNDVHLASGAYESTITDPTGAHTYFSMSADELNVSKDLPCGTSLNFIYDMDTVHGYKYLKNYERSTGNLTQTITRDRLYSDTDSDGMPDAIIDTVTENGDSWYLANDIKQGLLEFTTPEGRKILSEYYSGTLQTKDIGITGINPIWYSYDSKGRPVVISSGDRQISIVYNDDSLMDRIATVCDGTDTATYHFDIMDRLRIIQQPDGILIRLYYDANGNIERLSKPKWDDNTLVIDHLFGFNEVNLFGAYSTPRTDDGDYIYDYDRDRNLQSVTYPSGNQITLSRSMGRLELITLPEGTIDPEWKCSSKLDSITRGAEKITFGYELNGVESSLLTSEVIEGTINQTIGYGYDNDFNLNNISYAGASYGLGYDRDGLLRTIGGYTITLKPENGLPSAVTGNSLSINRAFTPYGESDTESLKVADVSNYSVDLDYDNQGRISVKTEIIGSIKKKYVYTYEAGRLRYVDLYLNDSPTGERVEEYEYYYNGARKSEINYQKGVSQKRSFGYSEDDRMLTAGDISFGYNLDGFQATKTKGSDTTYYTCSSLGELTKVVLPGGKTIEYTYDPYGRRIERKDNGAVTDRYLWTGLTTLLAVYDGGNNLKYRFEYADARMPVSMTTGGGDRYYLAYDQVGSLRLVIDSSGEVQRRIDYDTFGYVTGDTNQTLDVPFGFAGGLYDPETRFCRFGYRDYDTDTGRWTAKDPIFFAGGDTNLYGYCVGDPVNLMDPRGLFSIIGGGGISIVVGTGIEGSTGIAGNIDSGRNAAYGTIGVGYGYNVSADGYIGFVVGGEDTLSGPSVNFNFGYGPISISIFTDGDGNFIGGTLGVGPGIPIKGIPVIFSSTFDYTGALWFDLFNNDNNKPCK